MRAIIVEQPHSSARLQIVPLPQPGPGDVRLRVRACGLNFADVLAAKGEYQTKRPFPLVPGMEVAGTIDAVGPLVTGWQPGDRAAAVLGGGGLADFAIASATALVRLPPAMPFDVAGCFQIAYGTSHLALTRAELQAGQTLLVTGAAGGVGLTAVEVGHRMGARVIAVARGAERLAIARAAGADHLLDADLPDLRDRIHGLGGVDVAYEPVGGDSFTLALRSLKPGGRLLVIGFASGKVPQIPANHLLVKNITVIGFWWGGYTAFAPAALTDSMDMLMRWYTDGNLVPHIGHRLSLDHAAEGLELLRSRQATGKIVVLTDQA